MFVGPPREFQLWEALCPLLSEFASHPVIQLLQERFPSLLPGGRSITEVFLKQGMGNGVLIPNKELCSSMITVLRQSAIKR